MSGRLRPSWASRAATVFGVPFLPRITVTALPGMTLVQTKISTDTTRSVIRAAPTRFSTNTSTGWDRDRGPGGTGGDSGGGPDTATGVTTPPPVC